MCRLAPSVVPGAPFSVVYIVVGQGRMSIVLHISNDFDILSGGIFLLILSLHRINLNAVHQHIKLGVKILMYFQRIVKNRCIALVLKLAKLGGFAINHGRCLFYLSILKFGGWRVEVRRA